MANPSVRSNFQRSVAAVSGATVAVTAVVVLVGWHFNIDRLKAIFPGFISMKVNTAIALAAFASILLILATSRRRTPTTIRFTLALLLFAGAIGALTLVEYGYGIDLGIDQIFYADVEGISGSYPPGRLAPISAVSFLLLALGVYLAFCGPKRRPRLAHTCFFIVGLISLQALTSIVLGVQNSFGLASHMRIAVHTAVSLVLLCGGFLALSANRGFMRVLTTNTHGGSSTRRLLAAAVIVPPLVSFIETAGIRAGLYQADFGVLLRVIASMIFFVAMVMRNADIAHRSERRRTIAESAALKKERISVRLIAEREAAIHREAGEATLKQDLIEAKGRAEKAAGAKGEFLANMSHEIRTPLNGILGIADLLADTELTQQQRGLVDTLRGSGSGLLTIVNDILDFSKIDARKIQLENVDASLRAMVQEQIDLLAFNAKQKNLNLSVEFDPRLPERVNGDPGRVGQILLNLLGNAIKFTAAGSIFVRAELVDGPMADGTIDVRFSIQDTGIGVSDEAKMRLFSPFAQADSSTSRRFGGTGLGLSISRSLVELMNGKIDVISAPGEGSTFWFTAKFGRAAACTEAEYSAPIDAAPAQELNGRCFRILIAEDNTINQMVVTAHLKQLGYECQAVADGAEAVDVIKVSHFDLVLMDCQMPVMDGYGATIAIRKREADESLKRIPIVALTAHALREDQQRCFESGMDDYLTKPFKRETLSHVLLKWLAPHKSTAS